KAWLDALKLAIEFGDDVTTTAATPFKAIVGLMVSASERPDQPFLPSWLPVSRDEIERQAEYLWNQLGLAERHAETTDGEAATSARSVFARVLEPAPASSSLAPVRCSGVLKGAQLVLFAAYVE